MRGNAIRSAISRGNASRGNASRARVARFIRRTVGRLALARAQPVDLRRGGGVGQIHLGDPQPPLGAGAIGEPDQVQPCERQRHLAAMRARQGRFDLPPAHADEGRHVVEPVEHHGEVVEHFDVVGPRREAAFKQAPRALRLAEPDGEPTGLGQHIRAADQLAPGGAERSGLRFERREQRGRIIGRPRRFDPSLTERGIAQSGVGLGQPRERLRGIARGHQLGRAPTAVAGVVGAQPREVGDERRGGFGGAADLDEQRDEEVERPPAARRGALGGFDRGVEAAGGAQDRGAEQVDLGRIAAGRRAAVVEREQRVPGFAHGVQVFERFERLGPLGAAKLSAVEDFFECGHGAVGVVQPVAAQFGEFEQRAGALGRAVEGGEAKFEGFGVGGGVVRVEGEAGHVERGQLVVVFEREVVFVEQTLGGGRAVGSGSGAGRRADRRGRGSAGFGARRRRGLGQHARRSQCGERLGIFGQRLVQPRPALDAPRAMHLGADQQPRGLAQQRAAIGGGLAQRQSIVEHGGERVGVARVDRQRREQVERVGHGATARVQPREAHPGGVVFAEVPLGQREAVDILGPRLGAVGRDEAGVAAAGVGPVFDREAALGEQGQRGAIVGLFAERGERELGAFIGAFERGVGEFREAREQGRALARLGAVELGAQQGGDAGPVGDGGGDLQPHAAHVGVIGIGAQDLVEQRGRFFGPAQLAPQEPAGALGEKSAHARSHRRPQAGREELDDAEHIAAPQKQVLRLLIDRLPVGLGFGGGAQKGQRLVAFARRVERLGDPREERPGRLVVALGLVDRMQREVVRRRGLGLPGVEEQIGERAQHLGVARAGLAGVLVAHDRRAWPVEQPRLHPPQLQPHPPRLVARHHAGQPLQQRHQLAEAFALAVDVDEPFKRVAVGAHAAERHRVDRGGFVGAVLVLAQDVAALGIEIRQPIRRLDAGAEPREHRFERVVAAGFAVHGGERVEHRRVVAAQDRGFFEQRHRARLVAVAADHDLGEPGQAQPLFGGIGDPRGREFEHPRDVIPPARRGVQPFERPERRLGLRGRALQRFLEVRDRERRIPAGAGEHGAEAQVHRVAIDPRAALVGDAQQLFERVAGARRLPVGERGLGEPEERAGVAGQEHQRLAVAQRRGRGAVVGLAPPEVAEPHHRLGRAGVVAALLQDARGAIERAHRRQHPAGPLLGTGEAEQRGDVVGRLFERALEVADRGVEVAGLFERDAAELVQEREAGGGVFFAGEQALAGAQRGGPISRAGLQIGEHAQRAGQAAAQGERRFERAHRGGRIALGERRGHGAAGLGGLDRVAALLGEIGDAGIGLGRGFGLALALLHDAECAEGVGVVGVAGEPGAGERGGVGEAARRRNAQRDVQLQQPGHQKRVVGVHFELAVISGDRAVEVALGDQRLGRGIERLGLVVGEKPAGAGVAVEHLPEHARPDAAGGLAGGDEAEPAGGALRLLQPHVAAVGQLPAQLGADLVEQHIDRIDGRRGRAAEALAEAEAAQQLGGERGRGEAGRAKDADLVDADEQHPLVGDAGGFEAEAGDEGRGQVAGDLAEDHEVTVERADLDVGDRPAAQPDAERAAEVLVVDVEHEAFEARALVAESFDAAAHVEAARDFGQRELHLFDGEEIGDAALAEHEAAEALFEPQREVAGPASLRDRHRSLSAFRGGVVLADRPVTLARGGRRLGAGVFGGIDRGGVAGVGLIGIGRFGRCGGVVGLGRRAAAAAERQRACEQRQEQGVAHTLPFAMDRATVADRVAGGNGPDIVGDRGGIVAGSQRAQGGIGAGAGRDRKRDRSRAMAAISAPVVPRSVPLPRSVVMPRVVMLRALPRRRHHRLARRRHPHLPRHATRDATRHTRHATRHTRHATRHATGTHPPWLLDKLLRRLLDQRLDGKLAHLDDILTARRLDIAMLTHLGADGILGGLVARLEPHHHRARAEPVGRIDRLAHRLDRAHRSRRADKRPHPALIDGRARPQLRDLPLALLVLAQIDDPMAVLHLHLGGILNLHIRRVDVALDLIGEPPRRDAPREIDGRLALEARVNARAFRIADEQRALRIADADDHLLSIGGITHRERVVALDVLGDGIPMRRAEQLAEHLVDLLGIGGEVIGAIDDEAFALAHQPHGLGRLTGLTGLARFGAGRDLKRRHLRSLDIKQRARIDRARAAEITRPGHGDEHRLQREQSEQDLVGGVHATPPFVPVSEIGFASRRRPMVMSSTPASESSTMM